MPLLATVGSLTGTALTFCMGVKIATFFATFFACRLTRFGVEALLAVWFGRKVLGWLFA